MKKTNNKFAQKVTIYILAGLLLNFAILTTATVINSGNTLLKKEKSTISILAQSNYMVVARYYESILNKESVLTNALKSLDNIAPESRLATLEAIMNSISFDKEIINVFYGIEDLSNTNTGFGIVADEKSAAIGNLASVIDLELYTSIKKDKNPVILDPVIKNIAGSERTVTTLIYPVLEETGEFEGVVGINLDSTSLASLTLSTGDYETFENIIIDENKTILVDTSNSDNIGKNYTDVYSSTNEDKIFSGFGETESSVFKNELVEGSKVYMATKSFTIEGLDIPWLSISSVEQSEFLAPIISEVISLAVLTLIALIALAFFIYYTINKMLKPISEIENAAKEMAHGNLNPPLTFTSNDEIGSLAESMRYSMGSISEYISEIDRVAHDLARGDFSSQLNKEFIGDFKNIQTSINDMTKQVTTTLLNIKESSEQVFGGSEQVSIGAQSLAQGAVEQASALEELSATVNEISQQVQSNAENAKYANDMSNTAADSILESNQKMQILMEAMSDINSKSTQISKINKAIEEISYQTNILALNAAIEAARAGVYGKGFAVVADEVRNLAVKSSEATKETTTLIDESVKSINIGVKLAQEASTAMNQLVSTSNLTTEVINRMTLASSDQAKSIEQISLGIDQIASVVHLNSATSEQSAAASEELSSQAKIMTQLINNFVLSQEDKSSHMYEGDSSISSGRQSFDFNDDKY